MYNTSIIQVSSRQSTKEAQLLDNVYSFILSHSAARLLIMSSYFELTAVTSPTYFLIRLVISLLLPSIKVLHPKKNILKSNSFDVWKTFFFTVTYKFVFFRRESGSPRRIYRGADKIFLVSKCENWFCLLLKCVSTIFILNI